MTTTTEPTNGTALAVREMSLAELARRIDINVKSGWGLQEGTREQLNGLALYCQKHILLPGDDCTLYDGKPWITVDGRVKLMRRNPEYRGYSQRPLSKAEKEDWGWNPEDIVIETTVRTTIYGEIKAYGRVSRDEADGVFVKGVRHNAVARNHPVEMAQKRSLARAERLAFGTDSFVDDEEVQDAGRVIIEERNDPERNKALAAQQVAIFGADEDGTAFADQPKTAEQLPVRDVTTKAHPLWRAWVDATAQASAEEVDFVELTLPISSDVLTASTVTLLELVANKSAESQPSM